MHKGILRKRLGLTVAKKGGVKMFRNNRFFKVVSVIVSILFVINNISYAAPDIVQPMQKESTLRVLSAAKDGRTPGSITERLKTRNVQTPEDLSVASAAGSLSKASSAGENTERADGKIQQSITSLVQYRDNQYLRAVGSTGTADVIPPSEGLFTPGHDAYEAVKAAGKALIAVNIVGYNQMAGHMLAAMEQNAGIIFEVARSQLSYAIDEDKTVAYIKEVAERLGFKNPLVLHGDHIQYKEALFDVKKILKDEYEKVNGKGTFNDEMDIEQIDMGILETVQQRLEENAKKERKAIETYVERLVKAGFTSIAIDASTIYDEVAGDAVLKYYSKHGTPAEKLIVTLERDFNLPLEWGTKFLRLNPEDGTDAQRFNYVMETVVSNMQKRNRKKAEIDRVITDMKAAFGILHKKAGGKNLTAEKIIQAYDRIMKEVAEATIAGRLTDAVQQNMTAKEKLLLLPTSNVEETRHQVAYIGETVEEYTPELVEHFGKEIEVGHVDKKVPNPRRGGKLEPKMTHPLAVRVMGEYLKSCGLSFDLIATNNGSSHGTDFDKKTLTPVSQVGKISPWLTEELQKEAERFDAAIAQHGTSGSDMEELGDLAKTGEIKFNIATNYQQIILNTLALLDDGLTPDEILQKSQSDTEALVNGLHENTREKIKHLARGFKDNFMSAKVETEDSLFVEQLKRAFAWGVEKRKIRAASAWEDIATVLAKEFKRVFCEMDEKLYLLGHSKAAKSSSAGLNNYAAFRQIFSIYDTDIDNEAKLQLWYLQVELNKLTSVVKRSEFIRKAVKEKKFSTGDKEIAFDKIISVIGRFQFEEEEEEEENLSLLLLKYGTTYRIVAIDLSVPAYYFIEEITDMRMFNSTVYREINILRRPDSEISVKWDRCIERLTGITKVVMLGSTPSIPVKITDKDYDKLVKMGLGDKLRALVKLFSEKLQNANELNEPEHWNLLNKLGLDIESIRFLGYRLALPEGVSGPSRAYALKIKPDIELIVFPDNAIPQLMTVPSAVTLCDGKIGISASSKASSAGSVEIPVLGNTNIRCFSEQVLDRTLSAIPDLEGELKRVLDLVQRTKWPNKGDLAKLGLKQLDPSSLGAWGRVKRHPDDLYAHVTNLFIIDNKAGDLRFALFATKQKADAVETSYSRQERKPDKRRDKLIEERNMAIISKIGGKEVTPPKTLELPVGDKIVVVSLEPSDYTNRMDSSSVTQGDMQKVSYFLATTPRRADIPTLRQKMMRLTLEELKPDTLQELGEYKGKPFFVIKSKYFDELFFFSPYAPIGKLNLSPAIRPLTHEGIFGVVREIREAKAASAGSAGYIRGKKFEQFKDFTAKFSSPVAKQLWQLQIFLNKAGASSATSLELAMEQRRYPNIVSAIGPVYPGTGVVAAILSLEGFDKYLILIKDKARYHIIEVVLGYSPEFYDIDEIDLAKFEELVSPFINELEDKNPKATLHWLRFFEQIGAEIRLSTRFASADGANLVAKSSSAGEIKIGELNLEVIQSPMVSFRPLIKVLNYLTDGKGGTVGDLPSDKIRNLLTTFAPTANLGDINIKGLVVVDNPNDKREKLYFFWTGKEESSTLSMLVREDTGKRGADRYKFVPKEVLNIINYDMKTIAQSLSMDKPAAGRWLKIIASQRAARVKASTEHIKSSSAGEVIKVDDIKFYFDENAFIKRFAADGVFNEALNRLEADIFKFGLEELKPKIEKGKYAPIIGVLSSRAGLFVLAKDRTGLIQCVDIYNLKQPPRLLTDISPLERTPMGRDKIFKALSLVSGMAEYDAWNSYLWQKHIKEIAIGAQKDFTLTYIDAANSIPFRYDGWWQYLDTYAKLTQKGMWATGVAAALKKRQRNRFNEEFKTLQSCLSDNKEDGARAVDVAKLTLTSLEARHIIPSSLVFIANVTIPISKEKVVNAYAFWVKLAETYYPVIELLIQYTLPSQPNIRGGYTPGEILESLNGGALVNILDYDKETILDKLGIEPGTEAGRIWSGLLDKAGATAASAKSSSAGAFEVLDKEILVAQDILLGARPDELSYKHIEQTQTKLRQLRSQIRGTAKSKLPDKDRMTLYSRLQAQENILAHMEIADAAARVGSDGQIIFDPMIILDAKQRQAVIRQFKRVQAALEGSMSSEDKDKASTQVCLLEDILSDKVKLAKNAILISDKQKLQGVRLLKIDGGINKDNSYIIAPYLIALARGLLSINENNYAQLINNIERLHFKITQQPLDKDLKQALKDGSFNVFPLIIDMLPGVEAVDKDYIERLQRQAWAALIAA